jgi:hypothetical protein
MVQQFNIEELFPKMQGLDINQLLQQQAGFTQGMAGNVPTGPSAFSGIASGPIALNAAFDPTLAQMLETGAPVDVSQAVAGERALTEQRMQDMIDAFNARMGAMGKVGSTAHAAKQARGTQGLLADLFARTSGLEVRARESAAGRRMGALQTALGQGELDLGARQADIARARGMAEEALGRGRLGLAEKTGQAGAGMDMLRLLAGFAGKGGARTAGVGGAPQRVGTTTRARSTAPRPSVGGGRRTTPPPPNPMNFMLMDRLGRAHQTAAGIPVNMQMRGADFALTRPNIMAQFGGMTGRPGLAETMLGIMGGQAKGVQALGQAGASNTAAIMPLLQQMMQSGIMNQVAQKFGPGFAFGG